MFCDYYRVTRLSLTSTLSITIVTWKLFGMLDHVMNGRVLLFRTATPNVMVFFPFGVQR